VIEGKTPELAIEQARKLFGAIDTGNVIGLREAAPIQPMRRKFQALLANRGKSNNEEALRLPILE
jgi:hypothetical protein